MTGERGATPGWGDLYDPASLAAATGQPGGGVRLPDGRALSWAEYGSPRGVPCLLLPDTGSSRLAPHWLMHETTHPRRCGFSPWTGPESGTRTRWAWAARRTRSRISITW